MNKQIRIRGFMENTHGVLKKIPVDFIMKIRQD